MQLWAAMVVLSKLQATPQANQAQHLPVGLLTQKKGLRAHFRRSARLGGLGSLLLLPTADPRMLRA